MPSGCRPTAPWAGCAPPLRVAAGPHRGAAAAARVLILHQCQRRSARRGSQPFRPPLGDGGGKAGMHGKPVGIEVGGRGESRPSPLRGKGNPPLVGAPTPFGGSENSEKMLVLCTGKCRNCLFPARLSILCNLDQFCVCLVFSTF